MKKVLTWIIALINCLPLFAEGGNDLSKIYKQLGLSDNISYTAEMVAESQVNNMGTLAFKTSYKNGNIRSEGEQQGMKFIMIMRKDGTMFTYNDALQGWIKTSISDMMSKQTKLPEYKNVGTEEMEGKTCQKFEASDTEVGYKNTVWVNDGIILKNMTVGPNNATTTIVYKNIQKVDLEDSLFTPPQDANIQDMSAMLQNMMKNQDQGQGQPQEETQTQENAE